MVLYCALLWVLPQHPVAVGSRSPSRTVIAGSLDVCYGLICWQVRVKFSIRLVTWLACEEAVGGPALLLGWKSKV